MFNKHQQQELLTFGYVHDQIDKIQSLQSTIHEMLFPSDVIKIITTFYDEYFHWNLDNSNMSKFFECKTGDALLSPLFNIGDIEFQLSLYPDGYRQNSKGSVQLYVDLKKLPHYIENITIYTELRCETVPAFHTREDKHLDHAGVGVGWPRTALKLAEFKDKHKACFNCKVVIKHINYNDEANKWHKDKYWIRPIPSKGKQTYTLKVDGAMMERMKNRRIVKSEEFDNCWKVAIGPDEDDETKCGLYLGCFAYPKGHGFDGLSVRISYYCNSEELDGMLHKGLIAHFKFDDWCNSWRGDTSIDMNTLLRVVDRMESIRFDIEMEILQDCEESQSTIFYRSSDRKG